MKSLEKVRKECVEKHPEYNTVRWISDDEGKILQKLVQTREVKYCFESGTFNGWSALWMAHGGAQVDTFDIVDRVKLWDKFTFRNEFAKITFHNCRFDEMPTTLLQVPEGPKMIFQDGEKSARSLEKEFQLVQPYMEPGDILIVHETEAPIVGRYLLRLPSRFKKCTRLLYPSTRIQGIVVG
jgi:predicted O-methyltransferase YrrM